MLNPGLSVECNVIHVHPKYIIVDPVREPIPINDTINSIRLKLPYWRTERVWLMSKIDITPPRQGPSYVS
jgi:hypothetical protein